MSDDKSAVVMAATAPREMTDLGTESPIWRTAAAAPKNQERVSGVPRAR